MDQLESLSHSVWKCQYHVSFISKCRRRELYEGLRPHLGEVFRRLAEQKESRVLEGHLMPDHMHMLLSIPPKYAVSEVVGYIKGKSAIHLAWTYGEHKQNFAGQHFWARRLFCVDRGARPVTQEAPDNEWRPGSATQSVANRCAQCGESARWVRCGGGWKRVHGWAIEALPKETGSNS
jgi:putative transposase